MRLAGILDIICTCLKSLVPALLTNEKNKSAGQHQQTMRAKIKVAAWLTHLGGIHVEAFELLMI